MHLLLPLAVFSLVCVASLSTLVLYTYPLWKQCSFPSPPSGGQAPFRLLALGDPQLEGDSSLINPDDPAFLSVLSFVPAILAASSVSECGNVCRTTLYEFFLEDIPRALKNIRKRLDLWGNDYYLAHIYRSLHSLVKPTHVTVLGDLLGSQWVDDDEFGRRAWRFWNRVFRGGQRVDDATMNNISVEWLGGDDSWASTIVNIAGNHDIGYSGDLSRENIDRFQLLFGKVNWAIRFQLPVHQKNASDSNPSTTAELWIVILNSMNLDTPTLHEDLQSETYQFINNVISTSYPVEDRTAATVVLTHIPLHKEAGICTDGPLFEFYSSDEGGGLKEQNHLSASASKGILEGIYGMSGNPSVPARGFGRNGIILNGHDHEGCDVYHHISAVEDDEVPGIWDAHRWAESSQKLNRSIPGIREVTVRSMMGDFGGNTGLLSAWFDDGVHEWRFEYSTCSLGRQHLWWAVHILDLATVVISLIYGTWRLVPSRPTAMGTKTNHRHEDGARLDKSFDSGARSTSIRIKMDPVNRPSRRFKIRAHSMY